MTEVEYPVADDLLPTLPGYLHGIVGCNPWRLQCDGCGAVEVIGPERSLVTMGTHFAPPRIYGRGDRRRLCRPCALAAGWGER